MKFVTKVIGSQAHRGRAKGLCRLFVSCLVAVGCGGGAAATDPARPDTAPASDAPVLGDTGGKLDGGGAADTTVAETGDAVPGETGPLPTIVKEGVRVLPEGLVTIVKVEADGTVTLRGAVPVMKPGEVIVSGAGAGLARKVKSVSMVGSDTVLATEPAALTDIFAQAELSFSQMFTADKLVDVEPPAEPLPAAGTGTDVSQLQVPDLNWLSMPFDVVLASTPNGSVRMHGTGSVALEMDFEMKLDLNGLHKLRAVPTVHGAFSATFVSDLNAKSTNHRFRLAYLQLSPITFVLGGIPIVLTPVIEVMAIANLDVAGGFRMTVGVDAMVSAGFDWTDTGGLKGVADSRFNPTFKLGGAARMSGSLVVRPEVALLLYDVVGIYANMDLPAISAQVQTNLSQASVAVEAHLGGGAGWYVKGFDGGRLVDQYVRAFDTAPVSLASGTLNLFYNSTVDFSRTRNPSGPWTYGWRDSLGAVFTPFPIKGTTADKITSWTDPLYDSSLSLGIYYNGSNRMLHPAGTINLPAHTVGMHPGPNGEQAVLRFTAPVAGTYRLATIFEGISGYNAAPATTTYVAVIRGGSDVLVSATLNQNGFGNDKSYYADLFLDQGANLDFMVHSSNGSHLWDSTSVHVELGLAP